MVASGYVPDRGDLVWLSFSPRAGREQAGRRPALVLSPRRYNQRAGLALACPITSRIKGYPFEVEIEGVGNITGAAWSITSAASTGGRGAPSASQRHPSTW